MAKMKALDWLAFWLLIVGGINWGIYGASRFFGAGFDLITWLPSWLANGIFVLVGLLAIYGIFRGVKLVFD